CTYKAIIKRFLGYVLRPDEFPRLSQQPPEVAWMPVRVKKRDEPCLQRRLLYDPSDIAALRKAAHNPRDRAFITSLGERGARISEVGNRIIEDLVPHEHGFIVDLSGKTGRRSVLLVSSAADIATWLSLHPFRENSKAPMWVHYQYRDGPEPINYDTIRSMIA